MKQFQTKYVVLLIAVLPLFAINLFAASEVPFRGNVVDEQGEPMSYVSIYLRGNPKVGTISNDSGQFVLPFDFKSNIGDEVVFSFIGYATYEKSVATIDTLRPLEVMLEEQPVMLDGAEVKARISKKQSKKLKKEALERFVAQLSTDFPLRTTEYNVVSSYKGGQDNVQLIHNEMIGTITELPFVRDNGMDSLVIHVDQERVASTDQLEMGYEMFNDMVEEHNDKVVKKKQKKKNKSAAMTFKVRELDDQMERMHRYLWGGYTANVIKLLDVDKTSAWDYNVIGGNNVLTYTYKRNYLGIAKGTMQMHFYVDPKTFQVEKIAQSVVGELHIPFGYKLSPEQLDFINVLQMGRDTLETYKVKHAYLDVQRNVFFRRVDGQVVVREKNLNVDGSLIDRKNKTLRYNAQAKAIVSGRPKVTLNK